MRASGRDLTEGAIGKQILLFLLPLLGSSLVQQLYNTVDLMYAGNILGKEASAAVGTSSQIAVFILSFFTGVSVGASIIIAQRFGNKSGKSLQEALHTIVLLSFLAGAALTLLGFFGAPLFIGWMNTPDEIRASAISYLRIYFFSMIPIIAYNMGAGVLRAVGNARSPLIYQLIGGLTNVALDAVFLFVFDMGVAGIALATVIGQGVAATSTLIHLTLTRGETQIHWSKLKIDRSSLRDVLRVGVPVGVQSALIVLSNVFAQYNINSLGVDAIAAFSTYFKVELIPYLPITALGHAITTFTAQNIGAGKFDRVRRGTKICLIMGMCGTVVLSGLALLFREQAFRVFVKDPAVIAIGGQILMITFPLYFLYVLLEVLPGTLRGAGSSAQPMLIALINICILRNALFFAAIHIFPDVRSVAAVYPISWVTTGTCLIVYYLRGHWMPLSLGAEGDDTGTGQTTPVQKSS